MTEITEDGRDRIVADIRRYYYENSTDYGRFFSDSYVKSGDRLTGEEFLNRFVNKGVEATGLWQ